MPKVTSTTKTEKLGTKKTVKKTGTKISKEPVIGSVEESTHPQPIGRLGLHIVMKLERKFVNNKPYIEVLTADGQTFLLSDRDITTQYKPFEQK